jgi:tryptophanyl-tRNA synthetase
MSKSDAHIRGHAVNLVDSPDEIRRVIRRAVTDAGKEIKFNKAPEKAGVNNLLEIYELLTERSRDDIEAHFEGKGYAVLKNTVADVVIEALRPIRHRHRELILEKDELDRILAEGAERARSVAGPKIQQVKRAVGFIA